MSPERVVIQGVEMTERDAEVLWNVLLMMVDTELQAGGSVRRTSGQALMHEEAAKLMAGGDGSSGDLRKNGRK